MVKCLFLALLSVLFNYTYAQKVTALGIIRVEDEMLLGAIKPGEKFNYAIKWEPTIFRYGSTLLKVENDTMYVERTVKKKTTQHKHHLSEIYGMEGMDWGKFALKILLSATIGFGHLVDDSPVLNFVQGKYYLKQVEVDVAEIGNETKD